MGFDAAGHILIKCSAFVKYPRKKMRIQLSSESAIHFFNRGHTVVFNNLQSKQFFLSYSNLSSVVKWTDDGQKEMETCSH